MNTKWLQMGLLTELDKYDSDRQCADALGVNSGLISRVKNGGDSPTLRRKLGIPKHPPRPRLIISCDPATIARFDNQRGEMTRGEYLEYLMEMDR